jgi:2,3-bisphosphoglycerate-dependent phosphoglycerate mutase
METNAVLTAEGKRQAEEVAKRCKNLPVDIILASAMNRAQGTAEAISKQLGMDFETHTFLAERRRPTVQFGKLKDDPEAMEIDKVINENFTVPGWRHSDEENFDDLKERGLKILKFLEARPEKNILVIAHGRMLKIIAACVVMGEGLTPHEAHRFNLALAARNTGITVFNYRDEREPPSWKMITWNDHAHLG